jgi:hypothetical protein
MNRRDIVIGAVVLLVLAGVIYVRNRNTNDDLKVPETQTQSSSTEKTLEDKFKINIPDDAPKAELKATDGGDASGIATHSYKEGTYKLTVLADLPEPEPGKRYQGWIVKGEEGSDDYNLISVGRLTTGKGGYMLDYQSKNDYSDHSRIVISQETSQGTKIGETRVLEGSF